MSRIGVMPILVPAQVKVQIDGRRIHVEGPKGQLDWEIPKRAEAKLDADRITVRRQDNEPRSKAIHGLSRAIINNMVQGVSQGFVRKLEIQGVGFKASLEGRVLNLNLGYSHPIAYPLPEQVNVTVEDGTRIKVEGPSKEKVGLVASEIRSFYPPEPYKGKGVRYSDEKVVRKEGKTVQ